MPHQLFIEQDTSMWMTQLLGSSRRLCGTLAITLVVAGCSGVEVGRVDDTHHSLIGVTACLNKAGVPAYHAPSENQAGDWNIFDVKGRVIARIGAASVTITVRGDGDNFVEYYPGAAPQKLVDAVSRCASPTAKNPNSS
jgi:hypothetical protein